MIKGVQKIFRIRKKIKIPHTCTILIKVYDLHLIGSDFWLSNIMWCKYASLSYLPRTPKQKPLEVGWKEGKYQKPLVRTRPILRSKAKFLIFKIKQNPSFWAKCSKGIWIQTVTLFNYPRWCVKGPCLVLVIEWQLRWTNMWLCEIHRRLVHR
jgi:hypothetical protein